MTTAQMKARAKDCLRVHWGTVLLTLIISAAISMVINLIPVIGSIAALVLAGPISVGVMLVLTNVTAGKSVSIGQIFDPIGYCFVSAFLANLLQGVFVFLWSLLLVVPGIMKAYSYAMTFYVLRYEPNLTGTEALRRSESLMNGHRMELFKLQLSFIGWLLLCTVTFGLATIWVAPYMEVTETIFFDSIYGPQQKVSGMDDDGFTGAQDAEDF